MSLVVCWAFPALCYGAMRCDWSCLSALYNHRTWSDTCKQHSSSSYLGIQDGMYIASSLSLATERSGMAQQCSTWQ